MNFGHFFLNNDLKHQLSINFMSINDQNHCRNSVFTFLTDFWDIGQITFKQVLKGKGSGMIFFCTTLSVHTEHLTHAVTKKKKQEFKASPVSICQISGLSGVNILHISEVCLGAHQHDVWTITVRVGL